MKYFSTLLVLGASTTLLSSTMSDCPLSGDDDDTSPTPDDTSPTPDTSGMFTLTFLSSVDGSPVKGVAIWLGTDGTNPATFSDDKGQVTFWADSAIQDVNYGYAYSTTNTNTGVTDKYVRVKTSLSLDLDEYDTFYLSQPGTATSVKTTVSGTISGVDTSYESQVYATLGSSTGYYSKWFKPTATDVAYSLYYMGVPTYFLATQNVKDPVTGYYSSSSIPKSFSLSYNPVDPTNVTLNKTFDSSVSLTYSGTIDSKMTKLYNSEALVLANAGEFLEFNAFATTLGSADSSSIKVPSLAGPLDGAELSVRSKVASEDSFYSQSYWRSDVAPGSSVSLNFPNLHTLSEYAPLDASSVEGTKIDFKNDTAAEMDHVYFEDKMVNTAKTTYLHHYWEVYQNDVSQPLVFSKIPEHSIDWLSNTDDTYSTSSIYARSYVHYEGDDSSTTESSWGGTSQVGLVTTVITTKNNEKVSEPDHISYSSVRELLTK